MKKIMIISILIVLVTLSIPLLAQDQEGESLGLPGDNLNLYAVLQLFQESETLEGFEKSLNDENLKINNLDLDGNELVDYIKVIDYKDGDDHTIVLQDAISDKENQDVAVFTVQRDRGGNVQIQLIGDEELYGKNYIIEPITEEKVSGQTPNPGYTGSTSANNGRNVTVVHTTYAEIAAWPLIRFIYLPTYTIWHSSWYFGYYPPYWHPWRPYFWHYYYGYHYNWYNNYYGHYHRANHYRYTRWNDFYYVGRRSYSTNVNIRIKKGNYKSTYSHPDQRRDGEEQFARMHPEQLRKSSEKKEGNVSDRRSDPTVKNKSIKNSQSDHSVNGSRRSSKESSASSRRSSSNTKSDKQVKKSVKTKDSKATKGTGRR